METEWGVTFYRDLLSFQVSFTKLYFPMEDENGAFACARGRGWGEGGGVQERRSEGKLGFLSLDPLVIPSLGVLSQHSVGW